jgi:hypothetical protein
MLLGGIEADEKLGEWVPLAVIGVVPTKVSSENGPIRRGDLLVNSRRAGHAMKGTQPQLMIGAVVGKALENFDGLGGGDTGVIKVLVNVK